MKKSVLIAVVSLAVIGISTGIVLKALRTPGWKVYRAAKKGKLDKMMDLIATYTDVPQAELVNYQSPKDKDTPLHKAADKGHMPVVKFLVESGAKVNAQNKDGETPLHEAADEGHLDIVTYLIKKGANPMIKNEDGETALDKAKDEKQDEVVQYLEEIMAPIIP